MAITVTSFCRLALHSGGRIMAAAGTLRRRRYYLAVCGRNMAGLIGKPSKKVAGDRCNRWADVISNRMRRSLSKRMVQTPPTWCDVAHSWCNLYGEHDGLLGERAFLL